MLSGFCYAKVWFKGEMNALGLFVDLEASKTGIERFESDFS